MDQPVATFTNHPLNPLCTQLIEAAATYAASRFHYEVTIEHVLIKLLECHGGDSEHIFRIFKVNTSDLRQIALQAVAKLRVGSQGKPTFSLLLTECLDLAWTIAATQYHEPAMRSLVLLDALVEMKNSIPFLANTDVLNGVSLDRLRRDYRHLLRSSSESSVISIAPVSHYDVEKTITPTIPVTAPLLHEVTKTINTTEIEPIVGRQNEIHELINILCHYHKNNPILVGDAGVGKSTLIKGLAARIASGEIPDDLKNKQLQLLDKRYFQEGTWRDKLKLFSGLTERLVVSSQSSILVIDDIQELFAMIGITHVADLLRIIANVLAEKKLRLIMTITIETFNNFITLNAELLKYILPLNICEPTYETAIMMLTSQREQLQKHHNILITDKAIVTAVTMTDRYFPQRRLPEKALAVLDAACARVRTSRVIAPPRIEAAKSTVASLEQRLESIYGELRNGITGREKVIGELQTKLDDKNVELSALQQRWLREQEIVDHIQQNRSQIRSMQGSQNDVELLELKVATVLAQEELTELQGKQPMVRIEVDENTVAEVVADWTGFSVDKIQQITIKDNHQILQRLTQKIVGQEKALNQLVQLLQSRPLLFADKNAPLGVFLLAGPHGVGKSSTASVLADLLFGDKQFLQTLDFKLYQQINCVVWLRDKLLAMMKQRTHAVILCKDIEYAHPAVLQVLSDIITTGIYRDDAGVVINFKQTVFVLTSIIDNKQMLKMNSKIEETRSGYSLQDDHYQSGMNVYQNDQQIKSYLLQHFSPSLLANVHIIAYNQLHNTALAKIVTLKLQTLAKQLQNSYQFLFQYMPDVIDYIVQQSASAEYGAWFIDQFLQQQLVPMLLDYLAESAKEIDMTKQHQSSKILTVLIDESGALACEWRELHHNDIFLSGRNLDICER